MKIELYKTIDPINKLNKTLTNKLELTGNLKNDCDIMRPLIEVSYFNNWKEFNYCYIEEFGRYYFIDDVTFSNKVLRISMSVDVLMSFRSDILNSEGTAHRAGNKENRDIVDNMVSRTSRVDTEVRTFGDPLPTKEGGSFILIASC